jgi:CMP-N,N'-diacetyllegionaminic acid synthase
MPLDSFGSTKLADIVHTRGCLVLIPARGGSKGVPNKNIKTICGKPLIYYTIQAAREAFPDQDIFVSTDSELIASVAVQCGASVPFKRTEELSTDDARTIDVVRDALNRIESNLELRRYEYVVTLQPTTPLRTPEMILKGVELLANHPNASSAVSVTSVGGMHPWRMYRMDTKGQLEQLTSTVDPMCPRQELPPLYIRSGDVYVTRRSTIEYGNSLIGDSPLGYEIDPSRAVNIDTLKDFLLAELMMSSLSEK